MFEKVIIVSDLGPGDGGKGGIIHKLATSTPASAIIKFGGGQGSHGVITDDGRKFNFSQFGCGTFEGLPTYLADEFVAIPHGIIAEAKALEEVGIENPYRLLSSSPDVLCATPYHKIVSQIRELAFKNSPRGTIGTGAGVAKRFLKSIGGSHSLFMKDLYEQKSLKEKLAAIRELVLARLEPFRGFNFLERDEATATELFALLDDEGLLDWTLDKYQELTKTDFRLVEEADFVRLGTGTCIAELSHGVLTDCHFGLRPHVSALDTLPTLALGSLERAGYTGQHEILGVTRAYAFRHGAGSIPTADDNLLPLLSENSHKEENRWQGKVRVGPLDFTLLCYSAHICETHGAKLDGICVTWFDQIEKTGVLNYSDRYYDECLKSIYFLADHLDELGSLVPNSKTLKLAPTRTEIIEQVKTLFDKELGLPVRIISFGPDDKSKIILEGGYSHGRA